VNKDSLEQFILNLFDLNIPSLFSSEGYLFFFDTYTTKSSDSMILAIAT
jgi:hypothetical protein